MTMPNKTSLWTVVFLLSASLPAMLSAQTTARDQEKIMEAYMKAGEVTENHAYLKRFTGSWTAETTMWMAPGQPPTSGGGAIEGRLIMGGRFVALDFKGTMLGRPFEGFQLTGYDNMRKQYLTLWIDETSTAFFELAGTRNAAGDILDQTGDWADPMGGTSKVRTLTRFVSPDEYVFEQLMVLPDGGEFKSMEMRCVRKK
jgi:hypothetical protein